jgi:hypothetical protein
MVKVEKHPKGRCAVHLVLPSESVMTQKIIALLSQDPELSYYVSTTEDGKTHLRDDEAPCETTST